MNPYTLHHSRVEHSRIRKGRRSVHLLLTLLFLLASLASTAGATPSQPIDIQLLTISDWHAQLDPLSVRGIGNVGGAAALSSYFKAERAANPNTLTLTAGDAFGGSPALSRFFDEVPAVTAMNLMGFDADTFGNHNFDRGVEHLQEMVDLAEFAYVSANLHHVEAHLTGVEPYTMFELGGVKVAVIGITNPEAPSVVHPHSFGSIEVTDPVPAANKAKASAKAEGAQVIVAITHMGVTGFDPVTGAPVGPLIDFANNVGGFDVIFGDHTDVEFNGVINNALVVENRSKGRTYARTTLSVDPVSGRISDRSVEFVTPLSSAVTPDPAIVQMLAPYRTQLAAAYDSVIGVANGTFVRDENIERTQEAPLGNLVADSMRWQYGTQLAFTNSGGLRASLPSGYQPSATTLRRATAGYAPGPPYDLVIGDVFAVLPFGNVVVTRSVTGAQLYQILEQSVSRMPSAHGRFGQISGFRFTYDPAMPAGARVVSVALADGQPIVPDSTTYTLATNDFLNTGGDGYTMLADGQGVTREPMADVLLEYIKVKGEITPATDGRIDSTP